MLFHVAAQLLARSLRRNNSDTRWRAPCYCIRPAGANWRRSRTSSILVRSLAGKTEWQPFLGSSRAPANSVPGPIRPTRRESPQKRPPAGTGVGSVRIPDDPDEAARIAEQIRRVLLTRLAGLADSHRHRSVRGRGRPDRRLALASPRIQRRAYGGDRPRSAISFAYLASYSSLTSRRGRRIPQILVIRSLMCAPSKRQNA